MIPTSELAFAIAFETSSLEKASFKANCDRLGLYLSTPAKMSRPVAPLRLTVRMMVFSVMLISYHIFVYV